MLRMYSFAEMIIAKDAVVNGCLGIFTPSSGSVCRNRIHPGYWRQRSQSTSRYGTLFVAAVAVRCMYELHIPVKVSVSSFEYIYIHA